MPTKKTAPKKTASRKDPKPSPKARKPSQLDRIEKIAQDQGEFLVQTRIAIMSKLDTILSGATFMQELDKNARQLQDKADGNSAVVRSAIGHSVDGDDMQWTVNCPECNREYKCEGYFESTDIDTCKCGCVYRTERVYFEDGSFIS